MQRQCKQPSPQAITSIERQTYIPKPQMLASQNHQSSTSPYNYLYLFPYFQLLTYILRLSVGVPIHSQDFQS